MPCVFQSHFIPRLRPRMLIPPNNEPMLQPATAARCPRRPASRRGAPAATQQRHLGRHEHQDRDAPPPAPRELPRRRARNAAVLIAVRGSQGSLSPQSPRPPYLPSSAAASSETSGVGKHIAVHQSRAHTRQGSITSSPEPNILPKPTPPPTVRDTTCSRRS